MIDGHEIDLHQNEHLKNFEKFLGRKESNVEILKSYFRKRKPNETTTSGGEVSLPTFEIRDPGQNDRKNSNSNSTVAPVQQSVPSVSFKL